MIIKGVSFKLFIVILLIITLQNISANCDKDQVDINEASLKELDKLTGVGPAIAQNIIDARPYKELDDLMDANGIGESKLKAIKSQGLACIETGKDNDGDLAQEENFNELIPNPIEEETSTINLPKTFSSIKLEAKTIKSEENKDISSNRYAIYGLIGFGILLSLLLFFRSKKYKTEFKK